MKKFIFTFIGFLVISIVILAVTRYVVSSPENIALWSFQSIDTMKYSRDLAREKLGDKSFDLEINKQVKKIAQTGATHVAIATPYDEEFYPILKRWVNIARKNNLKVWFRGNFSGWEGWFEYERINRNEHILKTQYFISTHKDLFADGDIFTPCPECENGGPGDPRQTGDVEGHRKFLIDEYELTKASFAKIGKNVKSNFASMNGDVAERVMDKETTKALDGVVTIDHYVDTPQKLIEDIDRIAKDSGGKIVLGEFGAPIPDINGEMTDLQQASWIKNAMFLLSTNKNIIGLNYWTNVGSSTSLWHDDLSPKQAVDIITTFYNAPLLSVRVRDEAGFDVEHTRLLLNGKEYFLNSDGKYSLPYVEGLNKVDVEAAGYFKNQVFLSSKTTQIIMRKQNEGIIYKILKRIKVSFKSS